MKKHLISFVEAAQSLDVPAASLLREAEKHGFVILIGRAKRLCPDEIPELLEKCRSHPKAPASTCESEKGHRPSMSSETPDSSKARARTIADKLKSNSRNTSQEKTAEVVRLNHGT